MQDRQGTNDLANGAVRYGVYDASGNRLRYEWIRPEDEPLEAGTPLTAGNLLTEQSAAKIWRAGDAPANPMVNEAFGKLSEPNYHVGDILTTVRVLSAPWHACDGLPGPLRSTRRHDAADDQLFQRYHHLHQNGGRLARQIKEKGTEKWTPKPSSSPSSAPCSARPR